MKNDEMTSFEEFMFETINLCVQLLVNNVGVCMNNDEVTSFEECMCERINLCVELLVNKCWCLHE